VKLRLLLEDIEKDRWGQQSAKTNQQKLYTISIADYGEFENLCFVSIA